MNNKYVKNLRLFNPKEDLKVSESFTAYLTSSAGDTLSDLESFDLDDGENSGIGEEYCSVKTSGPFRSGPLLAYSNNKQPIVIVTNKSGEIIFLVPEQNNLKIINRFQIQGTISRTPAYSDGILYCTTREGIIYAINTGITSDTLDDKLELKPQLLWQQRMKKGILTEPIATGKLIVVAALDGLHGFEAYYKNETSKSIGRSLWFKPLSGVVSSPRIDAGQIYIGSEDKNLYAFEYGGSNISELWKFELSDASRAKPCVSQSKNYILCGTIDGYIYCVDSSSGKYKWSFHVASPVYSNIVSYQVGNDEYFMFGADNGIFYCINIYGKKVWEFKANGKIRTEPLIDNSRIYFGSEDNHFYALNIRSGKMLFKHATDGNINGTPVILEGHAVIFCSTDTFVHGVTI